MNKLTAVKFRFILSALLVATAIAIIAAFIFGYRTVQSFGQDVSMRQADAIASNDSVNNLQRLQTQLGKLSDVQQKIGTLRTSSSLPQFDAERSLKTITDQLGLRVKNIVFVNEGASAAPSTPSTPPSNGASGASTTTPTAPPSRSAKISFEFDGPISYDSLIRFLDAIETSTPKLSVDGITIPAGATRQSVSLGTITLMIATN